jgi:ATP-dependent Lhr-like helicase
MIRLAVEHFMTRRSRRNKQTRLIRIRKAEEQPKSSAYWEEIYEKSFKTESAIIFSNMRDQAEYSSPCCAKIAELRGTPDIYHVHHGSNFRVPA